MAASSRPMQFANLQDYSAPCSTLQKEGHPQLRGHLLVAKDNKNCIIYRHNFASDQCASNGQVAHLTNDQAIDRPEDGV